MSNRYIDATDEAAMTLFSSGIEGEIQMLNLLRFREDADYTDFPEIKPNEKTTGRTAYQKYIDHRNAIFVVNQCQKYHNLFRRIQIR